MAQRLRTEWILFWTVILMVAFGLVMLFSASSVMAEMKYNWSAYFLARQVAWAAASFIALMYFKRTDYRRWRSAGWAFTAVGVVLALLVVVWFADPRAHRWLRIGPVSVQPSEFAKPALILFLAYFVSLRAATINNRHTVACAGMALALIAGLVVVADLGTAMVLVATAATVFYVAGLDRRYFAMAVAAGLLCVVIAVVARPYRLARLFGFLDPDYKILALVDKGGAIRAYLDRSPNARDPGYHARQSKIAVGSGGVAGRGLMQGVQKLFYVPEAHTDFIYSVVAEELGFVGSSLVLAGFLIIAWRGLRTCWRTADDFGRFIALGVTASIVIQAFINMSVVLDLGPTKGIPLPMISHGGSSLFSTLISLGLLLSVSEHSG